MNAKSEQKIYRLKFETINEKNIAEFLEKKKIIFLIKINLKQINKCQTRNNENKITSQTN